MKYIDADLLRKEIEKHIKEVKDAAERFTPNLGFFDAKLSGIYDVMGIIDSLQQEQQEEPVSDDLEDEMDRYFESMEVQEHENIFEDTFHRIAKHFAEWGAEHLRDSTKKISDDLEKKTFDDYLKASPAERRKMNMAEILGEERLAKTKEQMDLEEEVKRYYSENFSYITSDQPTLSILTNIARHFAEWMKAKMMKGAVEGEVCGRVYDHLNIRFADGVCKYLEPKNISHIPADVSKYDIGDKVKIIVVKEDKK